MDVKSYLTQKWGGTVAPMSDMLVSVTGNGLKGARIKSGMTQEQAAAALGLSPGGYIKKEQGSRKLNEEFIRKACAVFGVKPEEIISEINLTQAHSFGPQGEIDQEKLASFVAQAKDRLSSLSELEAKNLVLALISASRRP
jgi:transcriptional regulator with XRE-family HTH domain